MRRTGLNKNSKNSKLGISLLTNSQANLLNKRPSTAEVTTSQRKQPRVDKENHFETEFTPTADLETLFKKLNAKTGIEFDNSFVSLFNDNLLGTYDESKYLVIFCALIDKLSPTGVVRVCEKLSDFLASPLINLVPKLFNNIYHEKKIVYEDDMRTGKEWIDYYCTEYLKYSWTVDNVSRLLSLIATGNCIQDFINKMLEFNVDRCIIFELLKICANVTGIHEILWTSFSDREDIFEFFIALKTFTKTHRDFSSKFFRYLRFNFKTLDDNLFACMLCLNLPDQTFSYLKVRLTDNFKVVSFPAWLQQLCENQKEFSHRLALKVAPEMLMEFSLFMSERDIANSQCFDFVKNSLLDLIKDAEHLRLPILSSIFERSFCFSPVESSFKILCAILSKTAPFIKDHANLLSEHFDDFTHLTSSYARQLLQALPSLLELSPTLRESLYRCLKYGLFTGHQDTRMFSVMGLTTLLAHCRLLSASAVPCSKASQLLTLSQSQVSTPTGSQRKAAFLCISVVDLLRRSLKQQAAVRNEVLNGFPSAILHNVLLAPAIFSLLADELAIEEPESLSELLKCCKYCFDALENSKKYLSDDDDLNFYVTSVKNNIQRIQTSVLSSKECNMRVLDALIDLSLMESRSPDALINLRTDTLLESPELSTNSLLKCISLCSEGNRAASYFRSALLSSKDMSEVFIDEVSSYAINRLSSDECSDDEAGFWVRCVTKCSTPCDLPLIQKLFEREILQCDVIQWILSMKTVSLSVLSWVVRISNEMTDSSLTPKLLDIILKYSASPSTWLLRISSDFHAFLGNIASELPKTSQPKWFRCISSETIKQSSLILFQHLQSAIENVTIAASSHLLSGSENTFNTIEDLVRCVVEILKTNYQTLSTYQHILRMLLNLYRLFLTLVEHFQSKEHLDRLARCTGSTLQSACYPFIAYVQNFENERQPSKKSTKNATVKPSLISKLIPSVVFTMEKFEAELVRLSRVIGINLLYHFKLSASRDFRINRSLVNSVKPIKEN